MKPGTFVLMALLAVSATANVVQLKNRRPTGVEAALPRSPVPATIPPPKAGDGSDPILAQLSALRTEIAELRAGNVKATVPAPVPKSKIAGIIAEQERESNFWKETGKICQARPSIKPEEYVEAIAELTADFLEISEAARPDFTSLCASAVGEIEAAQRTYSAAIKAAKGTPTYSQVTQAAYKDCLASQKATEERIRLAIPQETPRQIQFASKSISKWTAFFKPFAPPVENRLGGWSPER